MLVEGEKRGVLQKNGYSQLVRKEHYVHVEERKSDFLQFWSFIQFLTIYMIKLRIFMLPIQSENTTYLWCLDWKEGTKKLLLNKHFHWERNIFY